MGISTASASEPEASGWGLEAINTSLATATPRTIALWAMAQQLPVIVSTSFGEDSAATLHLMVSLAPEVPVVWVDTGFCGTDTRRFADQLRRHLRLNLQVYRPQESAISILNAFGVTDPLELDDYQRQQFTEKVKLEPFRRAIKELRPGIWITGIRAEETEHRRALAPVTLDDQGVLKVAPFFSSSSSEVATYLSGHELPVNRGYFDPTKAAPHLECGLHR